MKIINKNNVKKCFAVFLLVFTIMTTMMTPVFAMNDNPVDPGGGTVTHKAFVEKTFKANNNAYKSVYKLCQALCDILGYAGVVLLVWGIGKLVLAFKDENAAEKVNAITKIVVAVMFVTIKATLNNLLGFDF